MTLSVTDKVSSYQQLIAGLQKNAPNLVMMFASQSYTTPQIVALLQTLITSNNTVLSTKSAWHDAVVANTKAEAQYAPLVAELTQTIKVMYSNAETTLATFGLTPKKPRKPLTTEQLATRNAKAEATRKARGTTSKKQKATVSGNVVGVNIVPVTNSPSAPAASPPVASANPSVATPPVTPATSNGASTATPHS
jgi:hypothetical protein